MRIGAIKILISDCITGVYLRWWFNGWHYFNFTNGYEIGMRTENMDIQVTNWFSVISKIERPTRLKAEFAYKIVIEGIRASDVGAFTGLLMAEKVEQYEGAVWREVDIIRGEHAIREAGESLFAVEFEVRRDDLALKSSVLQKSQKLYLGDDLCDLDDEEMIPINKQVNDIAEMQDRQSDFTAQFAIRKTRAMKELFELSGEVGIVTTFPYEKKTCKLVHDGIEIISWGNMILDRVTDQYYFVAIYSGNVNFFNLLENKKITDLLLPSTNHTWNHGTMAGTHNNDLDYVYPLCEPSDDGGITPMAPATPIYIQMYGGWVWVFIKVKAIWDEIFATAGYTPEGDILNDYTFLHLHLPIASRSASYIDLSKYMYALHARNHKLFNHARNKFDCLQSEVVMTVGDDTFRTTGKIVIQIAGTYTFQIEVMAAGGTFFVPVVVYLYKGGVEQMASTGDNRTYFTIYNRVYTFQYACVAGDEIEFWCSITGLKWYDIKITKIEDPQINYGSAIVPHYHLPDLGQQEFIKMICNLFGLVPEADPRNRKIKFWNYSSLIDNIPNARDWSAYLSERDDEVEFKFGDYAQRNYLRYKESDDVKEDTGIGQIEIEDENLPLEKDIVEMPISTCDEVLVYDNDVETSRINFNKYNPGTGLYDQQNSIDPRLVLVDRLNWSPPTDKTLGFRSTVAVGPPFTDVADPKVSKSLPVAFSSLVLYYSALKDMLNQTNLRRAKFNLPSYEVAGFKHDIPIYLRQYKAYFYVNKITNYVPGKLCTIELIKL